MIPIAKIVRTELVHFENDTFGVKNYDQRGCMIYFHKSTGFWSRYVYDQNFNLTHFQTSEGTFVVTEYDERGKVVMVSTIRNKELTPLT
jgi:hypothetical protein